MVQTRSDVAYTADGSKLDVYRPTGAPPPPGGFGAIIALPGGAWRHANRKDYGAAVASTFGPWGYVVLPTDVAYATGGARAWPRAVRDVRDAVRYIRQHADSLGVNPDKVVVAGESAGGHLAALAGTLDADAFDAGDGKLVDGEATSGKPNAVINFYGPSDLAAEWNRRPQVRPYLSGFLGGSLARFPGRYAAASPVTHVSQDDAPTFIAQGTADKATIADTTVAFDRALKDAGVPEELALLQGIPHGFRFRLSTLNLGAEARAFLDRVWAQRG